VRGSPPDGHCPAAARDRSSLPFIVAATAIGRDVDLIGGAESAELIAAGLLSVLLFPLAGSLLLRGDVKRNGRPADIAPKQVRLVPKEET
jgi:hypothetical protein